MPKAAGHCFRRTVYQLDTEVFAPDWRDDYSCGGGLHISPRPVQARSYNPDATRFLEVVVPLADLLSYLDTEVGFITTMVDRITPRASDAVRQAVLDERGVDDLAAVATEPFSEWVMAGEFRGPHPNWESAGAVITGLELQLNSAEAPPDTTKPRRGGACVWVP